MFKVKSKCDGLSLAGMCVIPDKEVRGIVQLVHGMAEHKERYEEFMRYLAEKGYLCVILDHRGHGESVKTESDLGYFYDEDAHYLIEDIHDVTLMLKEQFPYVPLLLFGHSMGSLAVRAYTKHYDKDIDALIVCGSPSCNRAAALGKGLTKLLMKMRGEHYRSPFIQKLAFGKHNDKIPEACSENSWLCTDAEVVAAYDADTLCGFTFTLNGFENLFALMIDVYDEKDWSCQQKQLPILFVAGKQDPCIISEEEFKNAVDFMKERGYQKVEAKLYEGMRHEILNEVNKAEVYEDIFQWIAKNMTQNIKK